MKPTFVVAALFTLISATPLQHPSVQALLTSIEEGFAIDASAPPSYRSTQIKEATCAPYWYKCKNIDFSLQHLLRNGSAEAWYTVNVEHAIVNTNDAPAKISLTTSTTSTQSRTKGWTVGAKMSSSFRINGSNVGVEVSSSYSDTTTAGKTETRSVATETTCAPGYECRVETWTFHVTFAGECEMRPMFHCGGEHDVCREPWDGCSQLVAYRRKWCRLGEATRDMNTCEAQTPVLDDSGKPMARIVLIANKLHVGAEKRADEPETIVQFIG